MNSHIIDILRKLTTFPGISFLYKLYKKYKNREYRLSNGSDSPSLIFYVYGQDDDTGGLWWTINKVLMHIGYALDNGYIPVIDMKNFISQYQNDGDLYKLNLWERFFNQPFGYSLDDIKSSKNIIIASKKAAPKDYYLMGTRNFYENPARLAYFRSLFKDYIIFNDDVQTYLDNLCESKLGKNRVLGVLCRGTDYLKQKPKGHPVQPNPNDVIVKCKEIMELKQCSHLFLATEDIDILKAFISEFGEHLIYLEQERVSQNQLKKSQFLASINKKKKPDKFAMGLNYLAATYLLSKCSCFIGGRTGGTKGVLLLRNKDEFDYLYIYNLGMYQ